MDPCLFESHPKESNSLLKIFFSSNKIHPRVESRATSPRSKRDFPPPSEGKQFFLKKCYQKFSSSISQIHSRIQLLFQPFRSPPKESNSPSKIFFDKIHRNQLLLFLLFRTLSKRGSPPNSEGKQFRFREKMRSDSCVARATRGGGTYVVGLSYFLSREPREVYSEAAPRRPAST